MVSIVLGRASVAHGGPRIVEMALEVRDGGSSRTGSPPHRSRRRSRPHRRLREILVCIPEPTRAAPHAGGARHTPPSNLTRGAVSRPRMAHRPPHRVERQTNRGTGGPRGVLVGVWGVWGVAASDTQGQTPRGSRESPVRSIERRYCLQLVVAPRAPRSSPAHTRRVSRHPTAC